MSEQPTRLDTSRSDDEAFDFRPYFEIVRKRIWVVTAVVVVGLVATYFYAKRQPRYYQSTAKVVIDPRPPQVLGSQVQEVVQLGPSGWTDMQYSDYYNTQVDVITSYDLVAATVLDNELWRNEALVPRPPGDERTQPQLVAAATTAMWRSLSASRAANSRIVRFHVRHRDGDLAVLLANKHVETYIAHVQDLRQTGTADASKFLSTELDSAEAKLRETEEALLAFKRTNDALSISLEDRQSILARDIARYTGALSDTRIRRMEIEAALGQARNAKGDDIFESPIFALASNSATVDTLKTEYSRRKQRLVELSETLGPRHPDYIQQQTMVDEMYGQVEREARRAEHEIEAQHKAAIAAEHKFLGEVERLKDEAFALEPKTVEYTRLERQKNSAEDNYNMVAGRLKASEMSGRNMATNVRHHETARFAGVIGARLRVKMFIGGWLALLLGLALAALLHILDRSIKGAEDVERALGSAVLGIIPMLHNMPSGKDRDEQRKRDMFVFDNPRSPVAECCRSIRTNILFSSADKPLRTLTISSPNQHEGKTTTAVYLGTIIAQSGARVLLVDSDLRRPRLHTSLGTTRTVGLTNLVMGEVDLDDAVKTTDVPNLYLLPCGPQPPNPAELLLTNRFADVLAQLEERFDFILLDSPPLLAVTDAVVLARKSDGVILVTQADKTTIDDAAQCGRILRDVNANIVGVIMNDLDLTRRRYYYQYAYNYAASYADAES